jgi:nicotinamidase/pyrazinamidase
MNESTALLLIDIQPDFLPGGALEVANGDQILKPISEIAPKFSLKIATQDWHPAGHRSFASSHPGKSVYDSVLLNGLPQTLWPDHCVQGTAGAALHPSILELGLSQIIEKGTHPETDSYSGFFDNNRQFQTDLDAYLKAHHITKLVVAGLATDYCVKFTVLDALELGYEVVVFEPGIRGVNLHPKDSELALEAMKNAGAKIGYSLLDLEKN